MIVDEKKPSLGDHNDRRDGLKRILKLRRDPRFRLVSAADGVLVYRRR